MRTNFLRFGRRAFGSMTAVSGVGLAAACCTPKSEGKKASCCKPKKSEAQKTDDIHSMVSKYYGETLQTSKDLKTSACCAAAPPPVIRNVIKKIPDEIVSKFYGCGNTIPFGIEGLTILDLGCGSGRDCYIASHFVGEKGKVIGLDMTDAQLEVAQKYADTYCKDILGYSECNMDFRKGFIEMLQDPNGANLSDASVDLVISNCVINLSPRKDQVLQSVWNVLTEGGEFYFSDVYCDRRLSDEARQHEVLVGECLGGAMYIEDFRRLCQSIGFTDPRIVSQTEIVVNDAELKKVVGNARFYSVTYRLFKVKGVEDKCEDFGQVGIYLGTIPEHPYSYPFDDHHDFITNKPMLVCGNTAAMTGQSWLSPHFAIFGDTSTHYGLFDCSPDSGSCDPASCTPAVGGGSCC